MPRHSAGYLAETLAAQTVWGGGNAEETADWYEVDVEVVRECIRWVRCYVCRRGAYERAFSRCLREVTVRELATGQGVMGI